MSRELSRFQRIVCAATMLSWTVAKFLVQYVIVEVVLFPVTTVRRDLEIRGGKNTVVYFRVVSQYLCGRYGDSIVVDDFNVDFKKQ